MNTLQGLRRKYWSFALAWVALIYSTLYCVRPLCTFLQNTTPFALLVNSLMGVLLTVLILWLVIQGKINRPLPFLLLVMIGGAYIYGLWFIPNPEEKLHFLEYGILACLIAQAVEQDVRPPLALLYAFFLTAAFGWIDEGLQHLLPNRYYQNEDVALNAASGLLGLALMYLIRSGHAEAMRRVNGDDTI